MSKPAKLSEEDAALLEQTADLERQVAELEALVAQKLRRRHQEKSQGMKFAPPSRPVKSKFSKN